MLPSRQIGELLRILDAFGKQTAKPITWRQSKVRELSEKFSSSTPESDERAWSKEIFGGDDHEDEYVRLRSKLKRKLVDQLFSLRLERGSALRKAMYHNYRTLFAIKTLLLLGGRSVAIWLVAPALERARKFELTMDQVELLSILRQHATLTGDKLKFAQYAAELNEVMKIRLAELRMSFLLQRVEIEAVGRAGPSDVLRKVASQSLPEAREIFDEFPTFVIGLGYFRLAATHAEVEEDHSSCVKITQGAENFLSRFAHQSSISFLGEFAIKRLASAVALFDLEQASEAMKLCERYYAYGVNSWFVWKGYEFKILMHTLRFEDAARVHTEVTSHDRYLAQSEQVRQRWTLYGHYVILAQSHERQIDSPALRRVVRSGIHQVPIFARDKAGYNISLLILRYLILLIEGDIDAIIGQSEALAQYLRRHLRGKRETALYSFIKTLSLLEKSGFQLESIRSRASRFVVQFSRKEREEIDEAQILPFSYMWRLIVEAAERLETRRHSPIP